MYIKLPYLQLQIKMTFHPTTILFHEYFLEILYNFSSSFMKKKQFCYFFANEGKTLERETSCQDCNLQYDTFRGKWGWILLQKVSETVPTHNKHIFVRPKKVCLLWENCLFGGKLLISGSRRFRILVIVCTVETPVLELELNF